MVVQPSKCHPCLEPVPVLVEKGQNVIGGTLNKNRVIKLEATKESRDTVLPKSYPAMPREKILVT